VLAGTGVAWVVGRALLRPTSAKLRRLTVPLAAWPAGLAGLAVLTLSDLHIASRRSYSLSVLEGLAGLRPDLLFLAGDLVEGGEWVEPLARRLAAVAPRYGAFAVWGNHDQFGAAGPGDPAWLPSTARPVRAMRDTLVAAGVRLLDNQVARTTVRGEPLQIVGLSDPTRRLHDAERAFQQAEPSLPTLVLTHSPDAAYDLGERRADLVICGHTHGGQIVPPFRPALFTGTRHRLPRDRGLMHIDGRPVFVTAGVGTVGIPLRLNAPSEAVWLRLIPPDPR
jgi:predicted MPP superfamily phosphohydrolase